MVPCRVRCGLLLRLLLWLAYLQPRISSKLSSAHVYLRLPPDLPYGDWDALPASLINDAAQLVKANSIEGKRTGIMLYLSIRPLLTIFLNLPRQQEEQSHGTWPFAIATFSRSKTENSVSRSFIRPGQISRFVQRSK